MKWPDSSVETKLIICITNVVGIVQLHNLRIDKFFTKLLFVEICENFNTLQMDVSFFYLQMRTHCNIFKSILKYHYQRQSS
ncbi:hypothetical protein T11_2652 [Trichinella zimbabwensis]|uniref:Uncharacterized protein n=1 Tax=Trichinella zimbabwensis TaxID=268475 RepID=A0A0V1I753_9BILA|nr:hypothetical protein T11_2652 [Trichinella zimbabwensis]